MSGAEAVAKAFENAVKAIVMVFPTVGYVDTIRLMRNSKSSAAYNFNTIQIINIAQGTKVLYYFWKPFSNTIFGQSVSLLVVATILTYLRFKYENHPPESRPNYLVRIMNMARNCSFLDYVVSLVVYVSATVIVLSILRSLLGDSIVEGLGIFSNMVEATTSFPMFIRIVVLHNVKDVSAILVLQYLFGDIFKVGLYWIARAPWSFFLGAFCQMAVDIVTTIVFTKQTVCEHVVEDEQELLDANEQDRDDT